MAIDLVDDNIFFEFEPKELKIINDFKFKSMFKVVDDNGYKLSLHKIYKRSLSKDEFIILTNMIEKFFPYNINDVSGLEIADFNINKIYEGIFNIITLSDSSFDIYLTEIIKK